MAPDLARPEDQAYPVREGRAASLFDPLFDDFFAEPRKPAEPRRPPALPYKRADRVIMEEALKLLEDFLDCWTNGKAVKGLLGRARVLVQKIQQALAEQ